MLSAKAANDIFIVWVHPVGVRTHDLPHSRRAH